MYLSVQCIVCAGEAQACGAGCSVVGSSLPAISGSTYADNPRSRTARSVPYHHPKPAQDCTTDSANKFICTQIVSALAIKTLLALRAKINNTNTFCLLREVAGYRGYINVVHNLFGRINLVGCWTYLTIVPLSHITHYELQLNYLTSSNAHLINCL